MSYLLVENILVKSYLKELNFLSIFCVIYPTAILLKAKDFKQSFKIFDSKKNIDVVMGVSKFNYHPYKALKNKKNGLLEPIFKNKHNIRSQFYEEMYASNGTLYWHKTKTFLDKNATGHYANKLAGYVIDNNISMDIDYKEDLKKLNDFYKKGKK